MFRASRRREKRTICLSCAFLSLTTAILRLLDGIGGYTPFLQLGRRDQTSGRVVVIAVVVIDALLVGAVMGADLLRLPPIVIVLGDDLQDVSDGKLDARLRTRYQLVVFRIVLKQGFDVDLRRRAVGESDFRVGVVAREDLHHKVAAGFGSWERS